MAKLVGDREGAVQVVVVVQQHIGVHFPQAAGGESAGTLPDARIHVDPPAVPCFLQLRDIVLAHGFQPFQHKVKGLFIGQIHPESLDDRGI